jgi:SAM-dependent methyltransferase
MDRLRQRTTAPKIRQRPPLTTTDLNERNPAMRNALILMNKVTYLYTEILGHWIGLLSTMVAGLLFAVITYLGLPEFMILKWSLIAMTLLFTLSASYASYLVAPWLPTRSSDLERIARIAHLQSNQIFYDLGCGDGRIIIYLSRHTKASLIGVELSLFHYLLALSFKYLHRRKNVLIKFGNLLRQNVSRADVVYLYGCPSRLAEVGRQLKRNLKAGAKIISYEYPIKGLIPDTIDQPKPKDLPIHIYVMNDPDKRTACVAC